jgi:hypothetical protein
MMMIARIRSVLIALILGNVSMASLAPLDAADLPAASIPGVTISDSVRDDERGVQVFTVTSPYTKRANPIEVLLPDHLEEGRRYPVLYILPVGGEPDGPHGDGLREVRKADAHNRFGVICVSMRFDSVPWYGSHATDPTIRHDVYILDVVLPLIEARFPVSTAAKDRLLFGFSKSGFGAVSLLLRHPDIFGAACSWDAPLAFTEADFGKVGTRPHFGSAEQMAQYTPMTLLNTISQKQDAVFASFTTGSPRLYVFGKSVWAGETRRFHKRLDELAIQHVYDDSLEFAHAWPSGWVPLALDRFLGDLTKP